MGESLRFGEDDDTEEDDSSDSISDKPDIITPALDEPQSAGGVALLKYEQSSGDVEKIGHGIITSVSR